MILKLFQGDASIFFGFCCLKLQMIKCFSANNLAIYAYKCIIRILTTNALNEKHQN